MRPLFASSPELSPGTPDMKIDSLSRPGCLHDPHQRLQAQRELLGADPRLGAWIDRLGDIWQPRRASSFALLCGIIVNQQISVKAGATIGRRLRVAAGGRLTATAVAALDEQDLIDCGLSRQKRAALRDLAAHTIDGRLRPDHLWRRADEEVIDALVSVRGLGRWSAEMFLIFALGRPDVLSTGDLGLRNGIARLCGLDEVPSPVLMTELAERWRPWRSLASCYLWALLDPAGWPATTDASSNSTSDSKSNSTCISTPNAASIA